MKSQNKCLTFLCQRQKQQPTKQIQDKSISCYVFDNGKKDCYVGQSTQIPGRIGTHLHSNAKSTKPFLHQLKNYEARLYIYPIDSHTLHKIESMIQDPSLNVQVKMFLGVLEFYLIITLNPCMNTLCLFVCFFLSLFLLVPIKGESEMQRLNKKMDLELS